jgi:hypothetical protein
MPREGAINSYRTVLPGSTRTAQKIRPTNRA